MKSWLVLCAALVLTSCKSAAPPDAKNLLQPVADHDDNGAYVDPHWRCQESDCYYKKAVPDANAICDRKPVPEACAVPTDLDTAGLQSFFCFAELSQHVHGHVNLGEAVFTGAGEWHAHNDDFDYEFEMLGPKYADSYAGATRASLPIALEFSSFETFGAVDDQTPHWKQFHDALVTVTPDTNEQVSAMFDAPSDNKPNLVALGLFGLDCEHQCHAELHPVYAMAVRSAPDAAQPDQETWLVFARNQGGEGSCSQRVHPITTADNRIVLTIPEHEAIDFDIVDAKFLANDGQISDPTISFVPNRGAVLQFGLLPQEDDGFIEGHVTLRWKRKPGMLFFANARKVEIPHVAELETTERTLTRTLSQLKPDDVRAVRAAAIAATPKKHAVVKTLTKTAAPIHSLQPRAFPPSAPIENARQIAASAAMLKELCSRMGSVKDVNGKELCAVK